MPHLFNSETQYTRVLWCALLLAAAISWNLRASYAVGCATPSFGDPTTYGLTQTVYGIAIADYNRDGKLDVATANRNNSTVSILLGNGAGGFVLPPAHTLTVGGTPTGIATADFNRDGKADLVTPNLNTKTLSILLGNEAGGFTVLSPIELGPIFEPWAVFVEDFNADDIADIAVNASNGGGRILLGNGTGTFRPPTSFAMGGQNLTAADYNDDGRLDIPVSSLSSVLMLWGNGDGMFRQGPLFNVGMTPLNFLRGDFNADGRIDLAVSNESSAAKVAVLLHNGQAGFYPSNSYDLNAAASTALAAGDLNLDGKTDIASAILLPGSNNGAVAILLGQGVGSFPNLAFHTGTVHVPEDIAIVDLNQDGKPDLVTGDLGSGSGGTVTVMLNMCNMPAIRRNRIGDFDGDGQTDISIYRPDGNWYQTRSLNNIFYARPGFGDPGDKVMPGDFDGDGSSDIGVYRPTTGEWFTIDSSNGLYKIHQWGASGDIPVMGDYDGDGKTDFTVFRPSQGVWYIRLTSNNSMRAQPWGLAGDVPVSGDFDGDRKTDIAVFRPSSGAWYILNSTDNTLRSQLWGAAGDRAVTGDYDGDAKTDIAVFRPTEGAWYILRSSNLSFSAYFWGISTDVPVPADYDGDGKTDVAVYRDGAWYMLYSLDQSIQVRFFGLPTDLPIPAVYQGN